MTPAVRHTASRYELVLDGKVVGFADYELQGDTVVFPHTIVEHQYRGRGFGAILVAGALDDVRGTGRRVVAECWFVADFIRDNEEYQDLLAD